MLPCAGARRHVEKWQAQKVMRACDRVILEKGGAAYGGDGFIHQKGAFRIRPIRLAYMYCRVQPFAIKIELADAGREIQDDMRILRDKTRNARDEPAGAECRQEGEIECRAAHLRHHLQ